MDVDEPNQSPQKSQSIVSQHHNNENEPKAEPNEIEIDETGFISDSEFIGISTQALHINLNDVPSPNKPQISFPLIGDNPWERLSKEEKNEIDEFLDVMMPTPRISQDPNDEYKYKNHKESSKALIKYLRIKYVLY